MKIWISTLILSMFTSLAAAKSKWNCEWEMSKRAQAMSGILYSALEEGVLHAGDLRLFLENFPNHDPFSHLARGADTHSFKKAYRELRTRLKESELEEVRKATAEMIQQKERVVNAVQQAKEETAAVLTMKVVEHTQLDHGFIHQNSAPIIASANGGKPVFMTKIKNASTEKWREVKFAPFQLPRMTTMLSGDKDARVADTSLLENLKINDKSLVKEILPVGSHLFAYQSQGSSSMKESLLQFDLANPSAAPQIIREGRTVMTGLRHDTVHGKEYLSFLDEDFRYSIYDLGARKFLPSEISSRGSAEYVGGVVFKLKGHLHFAFADMNGRLEVHNLQTGDKDVITKTNVNFVRGHLHFLSIKGVPHLYYRSSDSLALLNLTTMKFRFIPVPFSRMTDFRVFEWKGHNYMAWGSQNQLYVYDVDNEEIVGRTSIATDYFRFQTFAVNDEVYAVVFTNTPHIYVVEIAGRDSTESKIR